MSEFESNFNFHVGKKAAMDKALACHAGGQELNPDTTKDFSVPILLGNPTMCTLSLTMPDFSVPILLGNLTLCTLSLTMPVVMCSMGR